VKFTIELQRDPEYTAGVVVETWGNVEPTDQELRDLADYVNANMTLATEPVSVLSIQVVQADRQVTPNP